MCFGYGHILPFVPLCAPTCEDMVMYGVWPSSLINAFFYWVHIDICEVATDYNEPYNAANLITEIDEEDVITLCAP